MMMENHQPFTSLDGASNQDTPERCPRPVYSQDCTEENHRTPQEDQGEDLADIKVEDTEGEEETYVRSDQQCKEEEIPTDISTDGASNRDTPERCPRPLYSQDCTEENPRIPQEDQDEGLTDIKIEVIEEKEEAYVRGDQQCKEEEIPTVSTDVVLDKYREFIQGFIEMYRDRECLWRVKSREYTNKSLRNQALQELVDHSRPYYAAASLEWVRKKIQNLRTVFLKEHKKIQNSWRSSAGTNDLYQPTLWYYNQLLFTLDQEPQRRGLVVMAERETAEEAEDVGETSETLSTPTPDLDIPNTPDLTFNSESEGDSSAPPPTPPPLPKKRCRKTRHNQEQEDVFMKQAREALQKPLDHFDYFGSYVASALRPMDIEQQIQFEHLVGQLIHQGRRRLLTYDTYLARLAPSTSDLHRSHPTAPPPSTSSQPAPPPTYPSTSSQPAPPPTNPSTIYSALLEEEESPDFNTL